MNERIDLRAERMKAKRRKKAMIKNCVIFVQFVVIIVLIIALVVVSVKYKNLCVEVDKNGDNSSLTSSGISSPNVS